MAGPSRRVHLEFFARLREEAGCDRLELETVAANPAELYAELGRQRGLTVPVRALRVAINARYAAMDTPLQEGDTIAFIPPVAGG
ncbi:MAG TPA: molybdopterin converting factor subunit 1 [Candidatus Didemnitutus sp.]|nr:molybdopterin converting factor subunit 1 [Candidatus Didemnitutus sp.]